MIGTWGVCGLRVVVGVVCFGLLSDVVGVVWVWCGGGGGGGVTFQFHMQRAHWALNAGSIASE